MIYVFGMIYLEKKQDLQTVIVPSHGLGGGRAAFSLKSTVSGAEAYSVECTISKTGTYYAVPVQLPQGLDTGEYAYAVKDEDGETVASGLCRVGDYSRPVEQGEGGFNIRQAK